MNVKFFNIRYDTDGENISGIPEEVNTTMEEMGWDEDVWDVEDFINEHGADFISDKTGWCVFGYEYKIE